ncbi:MAG: hypothetical protein QHG98_07530, partial [Methanothrix sp.]|nr:hypothetical protein [Methanothrix sp.]
MMSYTSLWFLLIAYIYSEYIIKTLTWLYGVIKSAWCTGLGKAIYLTYILGIICVALLVSDEIPPDAIVSRIVETTGMSTFAILFIVLYTLAAFLISIYIQFFIWILTRVTVFIKYLLAGLISILSKTWHLIKAAISHILLAIKGALTWLYGVIKSAWCTGLGKAIYLTYIL